MDVINNSDLINLRMMGDNSVKWGNCAYKSGGKERVNLGEFKTSAKNAIMTLDTP